MPTTGQNNLLSISVVQHQERIVQSQEEITSTRLDRLPAWHGADLIDHPDLDGRGWVGQIEPMNLVG
jgi:hypothetical protein